MRRPKLTLAFALMGVGAVLASVVAVTPLGVGKAPKPGNTFLGGGKATATIESSQQQARLAVEQVSQSSKATGPKLKVEGGQAYGMGPGRTAIPAPRRAVEEEAKTPPVKYDIMNSVQFLPYQIDANEDGEVWYCKNVKGGTEIYCNTISTDHDGGTDDWILTHPLNLEGGSSYRLVVKMCGGTAETPDEVEVCYGDTAAAVPNINLIPRMTLTDDTVRSYVATIKPETSGIYWVGIHAMTPGRGSHVNVGYVYIGGNVTGASPEAVSSFTIDALADPFCQAKLNFHAPMLTMDGGPVDGPLTMNIYRDYEVVAQVKADPGEEVTYVDYPEVKINKALYGVEAVDSHNNVGMLDEMTAGFVAANGEVFDPLAMIVTPPCKWNMPDIPEMNCENFGRENVSEHQDDWYFICGNVLLALQKGISTLFVSDPTHPRDAWFFTPGLNLVPGKTYTVTYESCNSDVDGRVTLDISLGSDQTSAGVIRYLDQDREVGGTWDDPVYLVYEVTVDEPGVYYLGLHNHTPIDAPMYATNLHTIKSIDVAVPNEIIPLPGECSMTVTPDQDGEVAINAAITAPTLDVDGSELQGSLTVDLMRDNMFVNRMEGVAPGATVNLDDPMTSWGVHTYAAYAVGAGGRGATTVPATVFVGTPIPKVPGDMKVTAINGTDVTLSWEAVSTSEEGLPIPSAQKVTYTVVDGSDNVIAENLETNTFSGKAIESGTQEWMAFGVIATTAGGSSERSALSEWNVVGDTPYTLPFAESFPEGQPTKTWLSKPFTGGGAYIYRGDRFNDISEMDGDNGMACLNGGAGMVSGKLTISEPTALTFGVNVFGASGFDSNELQVLVYPDCDITQEPDTVKTLVVGDLGTPDDGYAQWFTAKANLSKYVGQTVLFELRQPSYYYYYTFIDNILTKPVVANDLTANRLNVPARVRVGRSAAVNAYVENSGSTAAEDYTVELLLNDIKVAQAQGTPLEPGETTAFAFEVPINASMDQAVFTARVAYADDQNPDDNEVTKAIATIDASTLPAPEIHAEEADGANTISWVVPELDDCPITEGFEDAEPWSSEVEGWTIIDNDHNPFGGFSDLPLPGYENYTSMASWMVFDWNYLSQTAGAGLMPYTGTQYLGSMYAHDGATDLSSDEWLISPKLNGKAQRIEFLARQFTPRFKYEQIQFLTSTGGNSMDEFVNYLDGNIVIKNQWQRLYADVDEGTTYFALRCVSDSAFVMMLDDITYIPEQGLSLKGFNLYRNQELIAQLPATTFTYVDRDFATDEQTYVLTAVYDRGEGAPSNPVTLMTSTGIDNILLRPADQRIYNLQGVYMGTSLKDLPAGTYIMKGRKVIKQ